jgi:hypothetical protein
MKSRILCVAIALSMLAVALTIVPQDADAAVYYTGTVQTTDDEGTPQDVFFRGDRVYVLVETVYMGNLSIEDIRVEIQETDGFVRDWFTAVTDEPENGTFDSWAATPSAESLGTNFWFDGEVMIYEIVVYVDTGPWTEVARVPIQVKNEGLTLDPPSSDMYYPGQEVQVTIVTSNTDDLFYVQVVNDTFEDFENWTRLDTADGWYSFVWVIDSDMPDGDYTMNVRAQDNDAMWYTQYIDIQKYSLLVDSNQYYVLPGDNVMVIYNVVEIATLTPYAGATIAYTVHWLNESGNDTFETGEMPGSSGTYGFTIPDDIALYSDIDMTFWANESDERSSESGLWFTIGTISADLNVDERPYIPGDSVGVEVEAWIGDDWGWYDRLVGAEVDITVSKNGTVISAYSASGLITDVTGIVLYEFDLSTGATKGTYIVTATVSKLGYEVVRMASFDVEWEGELTVTFDKDYYYSGQTATFSFKVVWNAEELDASSVFYMVYNDYGMVATGNTSSGEGSYSIDDNYVGEIYVEAVTVLDGYFLYGGDSIEVYMAHIVIYATDEYYRAGDTIQYTYQMVTEIANATISYTVTDDDGIRVAEGDLPFALEGTVDFVVPLVEPSGSYEIRITVDDGLGHVVSDTATASLYAEYEIQIWAESSAGFTSRAFEPGATIVFGYSITNIGAAHLDVYRIMFLASYEYIYHNMLVSSPTGTFEIEVPETVGDGTYSMSAHINDPVNDDGWLWLSSDSVSFDVKSEQSVWDKSIGGLSLFNVLVLLLLLVMVVLLIVVPFLRGRMGSDELPPPRTMDEEEAMAPEVMEPEPEELPPS